MVENKVLPQIGFAVLLLATIVSNRLYSEALTLKSNTNNMPTSLSGLSSLSYPKTFPKDTIPRADTKLASALPPSILSDYYNSLLTNSAQNMPRFPANTWSQTEFIPLSSLSNVVDDDYEGLGDEYYNDDNSEAFRSTLSDMLYGKDAYQPEGWFNGPIVYDTPDSNAQSDKATDDQLNSLMLAYLLDRFDKINKMKDENQNEKRAVDMKPENEYNTASTTTTRPSVTKPSNIAKVVTNAIPKKLAANQFRLFQRGQKEYPLLRPAADNDEKRGDKSIADWPLELDETNLSQEESLMSLKQPKGKLRTTRDILTAQLDSLKKEGPKMH